MKETNKEKIVKVAQVLGTVAAIVGTGIMTYKIGFYKGGQFGVDKIRNLLVVNDKDLFRKVTELIRSNPNCGIRVIKRG